ncbi:hypothetical protein A9P82_01385 [Arachidicoccus ginsenosidimutans]|uniref:hypothetical protein n=1 Tax=Arachidicoccus sp. BS20 TaxID=1850526 RepID=UPI0007F07E09|nr:hypothetical protein [Arachidicoccus sp. BS20]ANI88083.1 hypothetical protein A9P82_01385 [Arachidicoccus sp. BS20]
MKKIFMQVVSMLMIVSCHAQSNPPSHKDSLAYINATKEFYRQYILQKKSISTKQVIKLSVEDEPVMVNKEDVSGKTKTKIDSILKLPHLSLITKWTKTLLPDVSTIISRGSISNIFQDNTKGWNYFYKQYGYGYYSFSAPVFFNNYSSCLVYITHHCGWLCGDGGLYLYGKKKDKWQLVTTYYHWIS